MVPNLYPIVDTHEVVVLSPDHYRPFAALDDAAAIEVFTVLRDRVAVHLEQGHATAVAILNHKREAGASLPHPHAQVLATDFVPPAIASAVARAERAPTDLVLDDMQRSETLALREPDGRRRRTRVVPVRVELTVPTAHRANAGWRALRPSARRRDRRRRASRPADALARLADALDDPAYNLVIHSAPPSASTFHWYVEITPRLSVTAGFEQATGLFVNTVDPTQAARTLNQVAP